ncbi:DUF2793 domain-containing protein [Pseudorhodoplanes sp.]|uniref:DUF2793 domain-containing protein n=1 Tax=Pseudorhodoplanes sp. TaxID=1934341 RepID=UPI002C66FB24|nr:DUF2793 domain-containing protein [Pseudorhodoplanes sp.]HWV44138.1 DUF2793 domain-containing protein [Pseudorhodoplanes sp.]
MAYGDLYNIGTASLDDTDLDIVHIDGALLLTNAVRDDTFEYAGRRVRIEEVIDDQKIRLRYDWPDTPFEDVSDGDWFILQDSPHRNPAIAMARTLRDQLDRLRIFDVSKPIFGVVEFGVNTPPEDYAAGDMLVVGSSPSGVFNGQTNAVARFTEEGGWFFSAPEYGWHIISQADPNGSNLVRSWDGSAWVLSSGLAAGIEFAGEWDSGETYTNGKVVRHNFKLWIATQESTNEEPGASEYWIEYVIPGEHGGVPIALEFDADTTSAEPSAGGVKINHATPGSATVLRISKTDIYGGNRSAEIAWIGTSNTSNQKGRIRLQKVGAIEDFRAIVMTVTEQTNSYDLTISSPSAPNGFFDDEDTVLFYFDWRGDVGATGATGPGYRGTSVTSLSVGATTPISFTATTGLAYTIGSRYRLSKSDDAETYLEGVCTAYNSSTGAFTGTVEIFKGSGTVNSWVLNLIGQPGRGYAATSSTPLSIGTGTKNLTTQANLAYAAGARVRLSAVGDVAWMEGLVSSYNQTTGAMVVIADKINNSGTFSNWIINLAGEPGAAGLNGADGASALTRVRVVDVGAGDPATDYQAGEVIDGVTLQTGDIILRATPGGDPADGAYVAPSSGAASRHGGLEAYSDHAAAEFNVMEGDVYASTKWRCTSPKSGTLDTDDLTFEQVLSMDGSNNLSELTDVSAARDTLELGDLATMNQSELPDAVAMAIVFGS